MIIKQFSPEQRQTILWQTLVFTWLHVLLFTNILYLTKYHANYFSLDFNPIKYFEAQIIVLCIAWFSPPTKEKVSDFLLNIFFLLLICPLLTLYTMKNTSSVHMYTIIAGFLTAAGICKTKWNLALKHHQWPKRYINITLIIAVLSPVLLILLHFHLKNGWQYFNLNPTKIYQYRAIIGEQLFTGVYGYLMVWVMKSCLPFLMAWCLYKKNWLAAGLTLAACIIFYGVTSQRYAIIAGLAVIGIFFLYKFKRPTIWLTLGLIILSTIMMLSALILGPPVTLEALILKRGLFMPAWLTVNYYDFFSQNELIYWSNKVLKCCIDYPYDKPFPYVVGEYMNKPEMSANTGYIATGFMHFGIPGVIAFSVIVGYLIKAIDILTPSQQTWFYVAVIINPILTLFMVSDLTTTLLTHGLLFNILLLFLWHEKTAPKQSA